MRNRRATGKVVPNLPRAIRFWRLSRTLGWRRDGFAILLILRSGGMGLTDGFVGANGQSVGSAAIGTRPSALGGEALSTGEPSADRSRRCWLADMISWALFAGGDV